MASKRYSYDKQYERSANEFLKLKAWRSLFQLIESQSLSKFASEHLLELFEGDPVRSMQLFVALSDKIKVCFIFSFLFLVLRL